MKKKVLGMMIGIVMLSSHVSGFQPETPVKRVKVYYFFTDFRCLRCYAFERYTKDVLERCFKNELESGKVVFAPLNIDQKENKHFINDYQLYTKAVIISLVNGNKEIKYKNLNKIWEYVGDKEKFYDYIKTETGAYLMEIK